MSLYVKIRKKLGSFVLDTEFESEQGILGILGASGCGKSMTLKCIAGIEKPDTGCIVLDGKVLFDSEKGICLKPQERQVGLLFQNNALFPNMNVEENLRMGLRSLKLGKEKEQSEIEKMLGLFYLKELKKQMPSQLSGGQQKRVALARILLSKPKLLMLDEPFTALDEYMKWDLELKLTEILESFQGAVLFVSHNRNEIYRICNQVCVMEQGRSNPVISVKELFETPGTLAAANLSGCKNFSKVKKLGEHTFEAVDFGMRFEMSKSIPEEIHYIGIRAHSFHVIKESEVALKKHVFSMVVERVIEDLFSVILMVRPESACEKDVSPIRIELSKQEWTPVESVLVYIEEKEIMLLK